MAPKITGIGERTERGATLTELRRKGLEKPCRCHGWATLKAQWDDAYGPEIADLLWPLWFKGKLPASHHPKCPDHSGAIGEHNQRIRQQISDLPEIVEVPD